MTAKSWPASVNSLILIAVLLAAWQLLFEFAGSQAMTAPVETFRYLAHLLTTEMFWGHVEETSRAFFFALLLAVLLGLIIGFLLGAHRFSSEVFEPVLVAFYSIPKITLYPIILLAFGLGLPAKIAFGTIHGIVPVAIFTMGAVRSLNPILLKTARVLRLPPQELVGSILLPAALPEIFTGIRLGFSLTLIGTLLGEMFGSQRGLGYLLMTAIGLQNVQLIMAVTLLIVLFAASVSTLLIVIDHRLHRRVP
ncbi:MAG TPA: ABC transporter permease subunit [Xanthobacteraceae bacterium]|jgi:NitT/TauT family transport system permease protein|nr:ABC transporter permease subunit [Xanthobacteraceae bacterium]